MIAKKKKRTCIATIISSFLCLLYVGYGATAEPDWAIVQNELIVLLQELIRADTQNPPGNEILACQILQSFFDKEGITSRIYPVEEKRANLLARLHGNGSQKAILLAAHTDVVPVNPEDWTVQPFSGEVIDGYIYGRGALDDKGMLAVEAMTLALLKRQGIPLRRDVLFFATSGEESGGAVGAGWMLERHRDQLDVAFALNEGGRIVAYKGKPLYIAVQTEEKTAYNITLVIHGTTGHSSVPRLDNAIQTSAHILDRIARYSSPFILNPVTTSFFRTISQYDSLVKFNEGEVKTNDPLYRSLLTNTISPTLIQGGMKSNVHPPFVEVNLNCRLLPGQEIADFVEGLRNWIRPGPYDFHYSFRTSSPDPSPQDGIGFILIEQVCREMFPGIPVTPYLSPGMSDATRFRSEGIPTYGLLPFPLEKEENYRMHSGDERLSIEALMTGMKLVFRLMELAGR